MKNYPIQTTGAIMQAHIEFVNVAVKWWATKRPLEWNLTQHLAEPTVNCTTPEEDALALACAQFFKAEENPQ